MKNSKTDTSKGLSTATNTTKSYKEINGKSRVGNAISSIWGGVTSIFTGKGAVQAKQDGSGVILKDGNGNVIVDKQINNSNWQNILAGLGILVGGIVGTTQNDITTQDNAEIQNSQEIRTGSNTLLFGGLGIVVLVGGIWAYIKFKK